MIHITHTLKNHAPAILSLLTSSLFFLKSKNYTHFLFIEFDTFLYESDIKNLLDSFQLDKKFIFQSVWIFYGMIDFYLHVTKNISSVEDYLNLCRENHLSEESMLEDLFDKIFSDHKGILIKNSILNLESASQKVGVFYNIKEPLKPILKLSNNCNHDIKVNMKINNFISEIILEPDGGYLFQNDTKKLYYIDLEKNTEYDIEVTSESFIYKETINKDKIESLKKIKIIDPNPYNLNLLHINEIN
jgi:hypothetical protein